MIVSSLYFGNIDYFSLLLKEKNITIDGFEHFEKQSFRNRTTIYGANGKLNLIVPIVREKQRKTMQETRIDYGQDWQNIHWKSIESAYRQSAFFEYYEADLKAVFFEKPATLFEWNNGLLKWLLEVLQMDVKINFTTNYQTLNPDYRSLIHPKRPTSKYFKNTPYLQVFEAKCGRLSNLSILDLLFNQGTNSLSFLI